jgi:hypothetical protein
LLGVGFGVVLVGVGVAVVGGGLDGLLDVTVGVVELTGLLTDGPATGVVGLTACGTDAESSCSCACRAVVTPGLITAVCCPHMLVATTVWAYCVPCAPARNALIAPEEISDTPANRLSVDVPTRRALIMAPSSWSSRPGSRVHSRISRT